MRNTVKKAICFLLTTVMLSGVFPQVFTAAPEAREDYGISPDYEARYPHGVIQLYDAKVTVNEGDSVELKLIRCGGTVGRVSVELKAIDVSAKYGEDYDVRIGLKKLKQDGEYSGTLIENYLSESGGDYITADDMLTDEVYRQIIGYEDTELSDGDAAELCGASVGLISDTLGVSEDKAMEIIGLDVQNTEDGDADSHYTSPLHELKDSVLGEKTAANGMNKSDMLNMDGLIGNNDENLAASAINDAAVGASLVVVFGDGENEKTIIIRTKNDKLYEPEEIFSLGLCNPTGEAELGEIINAAVVIEDNDEAEKSVIGFDTDTVTVGSDEAAASVDILRGGCVNDYAEITVHTVAGSASVGYDYLPVDATAVFLPGEERKTVIVPLKTSVSDQTELKTLDIVLESDAANADLTVDTAKVNIEPKNALRIAPSKPDNTPTVDYSRFGEPIILNQEQAALIKDVKDKDGVYLGCGYLSKYDAYLFAQGKSADDSMYRIGRIEIDVTITDVHKAAIFYSDDYVFTYISLYPDLNMDERYYTPTQTLRQGQTATFAFETEDIRRKKQDWLTHHTEYIDDPIEYFSEKMYLSVNVSHQRLKPLGLFDDIFNRKTWTKCLNWDCVQIDEIRLYPVKKKLDYDPAKYKSSNRTAEIKTEYRVFDGTDSDSIITKASYTFGSVTLPQYAYRNWTVSDSTCDLTAEAQKRKAFVGAYEIKGYKYNNIKGVSVTKAVGSTLTAEDMKTIDVGNTRDYYYLDPIIRTDDMDFITVEPYNAEWGELKIGNTSYNGCDVKSSAWREGDELILYVEPMFGYKCDKIEITRADGGVEYIKPGERVMMTKGMKVKPLLCEEDITVNVSWEYAFIGEYEKKEKNIANYNFTSDHAFTDNGDGTYTFKNMTPGDVVTMYLFPKKAYDTTLTIFYRGIDSFNPGLHDLVIITDAGSYNMMLNVLPEDYRNPENKDYPPHTYVLEDGAELARVSGSHAYLRINGIPNTEKILELKIDGSTLDPDFDYEVNEGFVSDRTGWWLRTTQEGETRLSDDMRYIACVGDAYAFTVDDHDMTFSYYLIKKDPSVKGALITGRVVTNGGTIKRPSSVIVTSKNVDEVGVPVAGATVSVLSNDPNDFTYENGNYYYASAETDKNGYFTVYLPGYAAGGLGYCISISVNDRIYQNISSYQVKGTTVFQVPYQNPNFQIDRMTLGNDLNTTEIALLDTKVKIGAHVVMASGYRAQRLVFRSYNREGTLVKEWSAEPSSAADWSYETTFIPSRYLREGGRLTVEIYDRYDRGQGEFDTGYTIWAVPKSMSVTLPQFDPHDSVSLPVIGSMTSVYDFGSSSSAKPEKADKKSDTDIGGAGKAGDKNYLEITFGASNAIKAAVKASKKDKKYESMSAEARAFLILSNLKTDKSDVKEIKKIDGKDTKPDDGGEQSGDSSGGESGDESEPETSNENNRLEKESKVKSGEGKSALEFSYVLGVYMTLYSQDGKCYFEDMTLYARLSVAASATKQFYIYGVPVYLKLSGSLDGELLVHTDPKDGKPLETSGTYYSSSFAEKMQTAGVFHITIKYTIGTGLGNPKYLAIGVSGTITMDIDYQPWSDGAGILSFSFDAEANILDIKVKYNIYKTSYGMFKTDGYTGTLDFSKVKNADKFVSQTDGKKKALFSYRDANSLTEIYGSIESGRGSNVKYPVTLASDGGENDGFDVQSAENDVISTVSPILMPINDGEDVLYLRLIDDASRGSRDYSSVAYSVIDREGNESEAKILDDDDSFDSGLTAALLGDGRVLAVWSDLDRSYGDDDSVNIGERLNHADLSCCIFDKNGNPGEVKKLTSGAGCDRMPTIAYDEATGKTFIAYVTTDYQTEGVTFDGDNLEDLGDFLYNSYSTVCFKVLDENGEIITGYSAPAEQTYIDYENNNGAGVLNGMRYLDTQVNPSVSQATIDELTAAASDGCVYVAYSLDTDKNTTTDEDRELYVVMCDLSTMAQTGPVSLTEDGTADTHPQIVCYGGTPLLFWNNDSRLYCTDLSEFLETNGEIIDLYANTYTPDMHANAASSYYVTVQPDGKLCIVWVDWLEDGDGVQIPTVFFREYDPDFKIPTGDDETPYFYGSWGNVQNLISVEANQDISEISYVDTGLKSMICYKVTNKDGDGQILSNDVYVAVFRDGSSVELDLDFDAEYPSPSDNAPFTVTALNSGSLPSEKVTVKAELVDKDGNVTPIGEQIFEEHYQSNGSVSARFEDFVFPDDPRGCKIRVTAWENDFEDDVVTEEFDLPYRYDISLGNIELNKRGDNKYIISLDVENKGNKELSGYVLGGFCEETDGDGYINFTTAGESAEITAEAKSTTHEVLMFEIPGDRYDEDGVCELDIVVTDGERNIAAEETIKLHKPAYDTAEPDDIRTNVENDELTIKKGEAASVEAAVMPFAAQNGYHVEYSVDDPTVASVDSEGNVTAKAAGEATLTVSVVKNHSHIFINSDGLISSDGEKLVIDDRGRITNLTDAEEQTAVLTKSITLTVTEDDASEPVPNTGEHISVYLLIFLLIISLCIFAALFFRFGKRKII